ncbi:MAG: hypothetical protein CSA50_00455 [Gammaproteobacteria bacterium]|nr:MAG: hypothetical protein CSA50_00455 [Gammaproteobacteria bacterium]
MQNTEHKKSTGFQCRPGCAACCIAPSIDSPIPGMPEGKPAGQRCVQLDENNLCKLFGQPERPAVCAAFVASAENCGDSTEQAIRILDALEQATRPETNGQTGWH